MSVLSAIVQAILQAIAWVFPISESAHSSIYHDFANTSAPTGSALTGVIHIGIAIGIFVAMFKLFVTMTKQFFKTGSDIVHKNLKGSSKSKARSFMYMSLITFVPMLAWVIPTGKGLLYSLLHTTSYNETLLDDGIILSALGVLVLMASRMLDLERNEKPITVLPAILTGVFCVFLVPVSGLSLIAGVFALLMLFGVSEKMAFRYSFLISVPVLIVMGTVEICVAAYPTGWLEAILGLIISAVISFLCVKLLKWVIAKRKLKYFGFYDISLGVITAVIGAFELIFK